MLFYAGAERLPLPPPPPAPGTIHSRLSVPPPLTRVPSPARSEQTRNWTAGVGERNAIRRALRREAAWRRRRSVVLLKVHLEKRRRLQQAAAATAAAAVGAGEEVLPLPTRVGGGGTAVSNFKRKGRMCDTAAAAAAVRARARIEKLTAGAGGGAADGADGLLSLRMLLEGVVELAGHEEALFQQIVMFL